MVKNEIWNDEIHITGSIRLVKNVPLAIEPGTTVYITSDSNDQHSGWSADDQYSRKYNDPVRLESWNYQGKLIYPADAAGRGAIVDSIGSNVKIENNSISI